MDRIDTKASEVVSFEDEAALASVPEAEAQAQPEKPRRRGRRIEPPKPEPETEEDENPFSEIEEPVDSPDDYLQDRGGNGKPVNSGLVDEEGNEVQSAEEPKETKEPESKPRDQNKLIVEVRQPGQRGRPRAEDIEPTKISASEFDELVDRLDLSGKGSAYIQVHRFEPRSYKGTKISGYLGKFDEKIDYEMLASMYGGGTYDVYFFDEKEVRGKKRTILIAKRRLEISGTPIVPGSEDGRGNHAPDIVERTIMTGERMMDRLAKEKEIESKKKDELQGMLLQSALSKKDDGKETFAFMKDLLEHQKEVANRQAEQSREEAKAARDELIRSRQEFKEEMRSMKAELEGKATREINPLVSFMQTNAKESSDKFGEIMKDTLQRQESMMRMMSEMTKMQQENQRELSKMQQESQKSTYETQIKIMQDSNKMKDEILMKRLTDVTEELKETRRASSSDLISKLKEFNVIKGLFNTEAAPEKESITDKIFNNLDMFPQIISSVGALLSKGTPVVMNPGIPALPPGVPQPPMPQQQEAVAAPGQPPPGMRDNMALELAIGKLKTEAEEAIENEVTPEDFTTNNIVGKYDEDVLKKIAGVPAKAVINVLEQSISNAGEDSVLITADGRSWLTKVHAVLVSKYGS